ncbi:MAG: hypothetical protein AAGM84_02190 [Pseudomonadota bacterium]
MNKQATKFGIERTVDTATLQVWQHVGAPGSDTLVVSFSSVGTDPDGVPPIEFPQLATAKGTGPALFIVDKTRSWLNAPGLLEEVVAQIEAFAAAQGAARIVTIGNSMGGYNAALIARFTRVDVALCFSPQASVHPDVAGDDLRWPRYRVGITEHRFAGLGAHLSADTQYIAVFGDRPREAPQYRRFPDAPNVEVLMLPGHGHGTAFTLKKYGLLGDAVGHGFAGDVPGLRAYLKDKLEAHPRTAAQTGLADVAMPEGALARAAQAALASGELDID